LISLFCPSRGRPKAAQELLDSFLATKALPTTELVFLVDADDDSGQTYPGNVRWGEPTGDPTGPLNRAAVTSTAEIVGFIGDDSRFETAGWDALVEAQLRSPGFCWADDGHDIPWPSTIFVSKKIVNALGWLALPSLKRGYFDVVWIELAARSGMTRKLPRVMIRHDNSKGVVAPEVIAADEAAFNLWKQTEMNNDVRKVRLTDLDRFF
jgi:hypothetical protein